MCQLDMCCGSGSGLIAALRMGYSVAGFDTNKTQVEAARRRVASFAEQEVILQAIDRPHSYIDIYVCYFTLRVTSQIVLC